MEELSEIHLLPEELEEYSKFSRLMNLLKKLRLKRQADLELETEQAMKNMQQPTAVQPVAPSTAGLSAAPVAPQPEPLSQVAMPKPVNAKLEPLTTENKEMSVRVASASPNNPFERMLMRKFAALSDDGKPSLEEAAAIGLAGLAGTAAGNRLAPAGSTWMAQEALGAHFGKDNSELVRLMAEDGGSRAARTRALDRVRNTARQLGVTDPGGLWFRSPENILQRAADVESSLASKLTRSKLGPFKALGALGAALGAAALLKNRGDKGLSSYIGATPMDASVGAYPEPMQSSVGLYPEQMPVDMGGQY
jgi:hypothetical protein